MDVRLSQTFTQVGATSIACPGAYLPAAGRAVLATGIVKRVIVKGNPDPGGAVTVAVYDAHDVNGATFRSANRVKGEIDLTGATAMRQSVFELVGTAIGGGPVLSTYNKKAEWIVPPSDFTGGVGIEYSGGQVEVDCDIMCLHGMIVLVSGMTAATFSVVYQPRTLGKARYRRATTQIPAY